MLRIYFLQLWFNLSDRRWKKPCMTRWRCAALSASILESKALRMRRPVWQFRHLLERNKLGKVLLTAVNEHLRRGGIKIAKGTIVDATIIGAPSSTKNQDGKARPGDASDGQGPAVVFSA